METQGSPRTITEEIYRDLRMKILQNQFQPNEHLVERKLAQSYGVSKTPIREAITRLERDGLVKFVSLKGAVVRYFAKEEMLQILDIREYLEALAGAKAAEFSARDGVAREIEEIHAQSALHLDNRKVFQTYDRWLHNTIRRAAHNDLLFTMVEKLDDVFHMVLTSTMALPTRGPHVAFLEHQELVQAIVQGDPGQAEAVSRCHIQAVRKAVEQFYDAP